MRKDKISRLHCAPLVECVRMDVPLLVPQYLSYRLGARRGAMALVHLNNGDPSPPEAYIFVVESTYRREAR